MHTRKSSEEKIICFFHANCTDGAAAAAVIKYKYPQAKCYPMNHGDPIRARVKGKRVFIVDFSFKEDILKNFKQEATSVHWYDHHITALPTRDLLGWGVLDLKESGASLTWKQEFPNKAMPKVLEYVKDKDLYEWKLPHSREINMYLRGVEDITNPLSTCWKELLNLKENDPKWQSMIEEGRLALEFQKKTLKKGLKNAFAIDFHGHRTLAVNWSLEASDMGEYIYKDLGYDVALMFFFTGSIFNFSLRSTKVDVSKIALEYGGGGHPGAAGFRKDNIDFLLKMKKLQK
ncbi:MAG: hypothetical protein KDK66_00360 [Deltaproteobacteria bacterium]|nr:hypothetical protein [Deltaproteobacteria bacterium]